MPRKRHDSRSDDSDSYSSDEDSSNKRQHDKRSRKIHVSKSSPLLKKGSSSSVYKDAKGDRDSRYEKEDGDKRYTSANQRHSADRYSHFRDTRRRGEKDDQRREGEKDDRRREGGKNDHRRGSEKDAQRQGGEKDGQRGRTDDRRDETKRNRDTHQRRSGDESRMENWKRSRDGDKEKVKKMGGSRNVSPSREESSRNEGSKSSDDERKTSTTDTRRERKKNSPTGVSNSKEMLKEKEKSRNKMLPDSSRTGESFQKERNKMEQTTRKQYGEKKDTRGRKKRPTDTSSSSSEDDSSDSESDSESSDSKSDDRMVKARKEPVVSNTGKQESDKQDRTGELKEGKLPVIVKKAYESPRKDSFEEGRSGHSSDESGSDSQKSGDERESKYSQNKMESNEAKEDAATEANKHSNKDGNEKRSPGEPQYSLRETVEESRDTGSEEEKEEGEISEDNEDKMPNKPLKSISDYVSDISSDDGNAESLQFTEVQKQHIITNQASPSKPPQTDKGSPENVNQHNKSQKAPQADKRTVAVVREKSYNDADKAKRDTNNFSDREVIDGEDNSKRQRPVLESESDDDSSYDRDNEKSATRSSAHSKQKMGSSVSVVRQTSSRRDGDRLRDRDHEKEQRGDRKEKDIRSRNDNEREKKRDRDGETKRESENVEQKKTVSTKSGKPDDVAAPKNSEDSVKKPVVAFDITTKTGGAYIPPAKLRMMQEQITDKTSVAYQRMSWEALKKSINGLINKVNVSNIIEIIKELFQENIVRGRGLLARSVIQAQAASPTFTHVYAALVAVINTKFPQNGELILRRLILMFRRGYKRNDKALCLSSTRFVAHLVNQQVAHEVLALEILTLLLENPTDDAVEVAIGFLKECGQKLTEVSPRGINSIFERLRNVLHEGQLDMRVQYMVEVMFAIRKDGFKDHQSVLQDLDLVEEDEQFTHLLQLEDVVNGDELLNVFKEDPSYAENEEKYKALKKEILEEGSSDEESGGSSGSDASESDSADEEAENAEKQAIIDKTETNLIALRRTIYLTVQSSLDHNECAHKMLKMELKPGQEVELCNMILDCCAQLRTYEKFFGLLGQRFCQIDKKYIEPFQQIFIEQYETIHRLETNKLRNVAKFFAHLLYTDAISWGVLSVVKLTEEDTTSASRIFLKILFQELSEYMGLFKLNERLKDPTLAPYFKGIMARDNPKNTRFSINFFTTIGLGGLTDDLREHLKTATKRIAQQNQEADHGESSSSTDASTDSSSDSDSSSASESDSSPRRNQKPSSKKKGKADKESTKSKKRAADKENKRESARKRKSLDSENKSGSKSKSSGKGGGRNAKEKNVLQGKSPKTIADRLLDMAEYGNIQNGDEQSRGRNERQKWDGEKEARNQFSRRDEERERRSGQNGREFEDRSRENGERWEQNEKRWNGSEERGDRRQEENFSYRGRNWEDRGQRQEDGRRFEGRQNEFNNFRRREDGSHQRNDGFWDRRHDPGPGSNRYWKSDYDTEESRQNKAGDGDRRRDVRRGEVSADKRYDNSSDEQSESSPDHRKQRKGGNLVSLSSTDRRDMKRSADVDSVQKQASKRRHNRHSSSESSTDSSDDNQGKSSRPGKGHRSSKSKSDRSQKNTRKKSLSSNDSSAATPTSSSSSSSSDEEEVQERRIITKKPRLSELSEDRNKKGQEVLGERGGEKNRDRRRK